MSRFKDALAGTFGPKFNKMRGGGGVGGGFIRMSWVENFLKINKRGGGRGGRLLET